MAKAVPKWPKMVPDSSRLLKVAQDSPRWVRTAQDGPRCLKIGQNGSNRGIIEVGEFIQERNIPVTFWLRMLVHTTV